MKVPLSSSSLLPRRSPLPRYLFPLLVFLGFIVVFHSQNFSFSLSNYRFLSLVSPIVVAPIPVSDHHPPPPPTPEKKIEKKVEKKREEKNKKALAFAVGTTEKECDIFDGRWVWDESRPLYKESECPYIHPQLTCQDHGRPDKGYQHWRWQPHSCSLPAFNATMMLEALRGKRMLFVGDSLNRGQYASMVCLLQSVIPEGAKSMKSSYDSLTVFRAEKYNASIEFYWAPFLLDSNSDDAIKHRIIHKIVRKSVNKHGKYWKGADVVVFNTYLWWMTSPNIKVLKKGSLKDEEEPETVEMKAEDGYRMAMKTMLSWVQKNMDPNKSRVFFTSMSPTHTNGLDWGGKANGNCYNQTTMVEDPTYWASSASKTIMQVIGQEFRKSKVPISLLNITRLSNYRKDAHTSIYKKQWNPLTPEQLANPVSYADCIHWCLPGLHDIWNELLFAKLFYP